MISLPVIRKAYSSERGGSLTQRFERKFRRLHFINPSPQSDELYRSLEKFSALRSATSPGSGQRHCDPSEEERDARANVLMMSSTCC